MTVRSVTAALLAASLALGVPASTAFAQGYSGSAASVAASTGATAAPATGYGR